MTTYWITFRIADKTVGGRSWEERYSDLMDAIQNNSTLWWKEPTSFIAFESAGSIDGLAQQFEAVVEPSEDLFLLRAMDTKSARICGKNDDNDIYKLMPYLKAV